MRVLCVFVAGVFTIDKNVEAEATHINNAEEARQTSVHGEEHGQAEQHCREANEVPLLLLLSRETFIHHDSPVCSRSVQ
jgi:hypothetical protein